MPSEYVAPGVYVQDLPTVPPLIEPHGTGVAAFLGSARKGTSYRAYQIRSVAEFVGRFGALKTELELGYAIDQFFANGGVVAWVVRVAQHATAEQWQRGLTALNKVRLFDLLVIPGVEGASARDESLTYAQSRKAFLILDAPRTSTTVALMHGAEATLPVSADAAVYFPWVEIADPAGAVAGAKRLAAPSGSVAGVIARIDAQRGIWKSPAGIEATIKGAKSLPVAVNDLQNGELNALAVNCLRQFPGKDSPVIFGARTRAGANASGSEWKYVNVRRLALFLERSIDQGLQWVVFEPNGEMLWQKIRSSAEEFLFQYFRQGAFQGSRPSEAYFVKCDQGTMTAADITEGAVHVLVGFAPTKPAEFIVLKLTFKTQPG